jgi:hypothetical protein
MGYFDTINWDKLKADLEKGLQQGLVAVKKGAMVAKKKAEELTVEGKRQYKILSLKAKAHKGISDLGARVYAIMGTTAKNPAQDAKVKELAAQIKKMEIEIALLEQLPKKAAKKKTKKTARKK